MNPELTKLFDVLRKKLHYLEGFADACDSPPLRDWVGDARRVLNQYEKQTGENKE